MGLRRTGSSWRGPCPACGGGSRSQKFALTENADGRPLWRCHAGCDQVDITRELQHLGLLPRARGKASTRTTPGRHHSREVVELAALLVLVADADLRRGELPTESDRHALLRAARIVREAHAPHLPAWRLARQALLRPPLTTCLSAIGGQPT